jgi:preprotein translocase subunit SecF
VFIGTYSSIYISTPVLVWLGVTPQSFVKNQGGGESEAQPA